MDFEKDVRRLDHEYGMLNPDIGKGSGWFSELAPCAQHGAYLADWGV